MVTGPHVSPQVYEAMNVTQRWRRRRTPFCRLLSGSRSDGLKLKEAGLCHGIELALN